METMMGVKYPPIDFASIPQSVAGMTPGTDYDGIRGYCVDTDGAYTFVFEDGSEATLYRVRGVDYGGRVTQLKTSPTPAGSVIGYG